MKKLLLFFLFISQVCFSQKIQNSTNIPKATSTGGGTTIDTAALSATVQAKVTSSVTPLQTAINALNTAIANKVDIIAGKGLSTNDYTNTEKANVAAALSGLTGKVDKITGMGLSTNDYSNTEKASLAAAITNIATNTTAILNKVDKVTGKQLSTEDYSTVEKTQVATVWQKEVLVDYYIPSGATGDLAVYIQAALNASNGKKLVFTPGKTYSFSSVFLPSNIKIDFNNCNLIPAFSTSFGGSWMLNYNSTHIDGSGNYTTTTSSGGTSSVPIVAENIEIYNANFDGQFGRIGLFKANGGTYTYAKNIKVYNNKIKNFSFDAVNFNSPSLVIGSGNLYYENLLIEGNDFKYGGAFTGCIISGNYSTTNTSMVVKTIDGSPIASRMLTGMLFQLSTGEITGLDALGTSTTAAIYRCTGFTVGSTPDQGTITFAAGSYDATNGFILDGSNTGLHAPIVDGCWMLPISQVDYGLINTLPLFNGTSGQTTLTRAATTTLENAYATNLAVGMQISFSAGTVGLYTITAISGTDGSLTITPALTSTFSSQRPAANGQYGKCVAILGEVRNGVIQKNKFFASYEAVSIGGTYGGFLTWDELNTNFNFLDNEIWYQWMGVEGIPGGVLNSPFTDFSNLTLTAGQTSIPNANPGNYRITTKDLDGNGNADTILVASTTTDLAATGSNSLVVGDILMFHGVKGRYIITSLTTSAITIARYDHNSRGTVTGGLANGGTAIGYRRLYSSTLGQAGGFNTLTFKRNNFHFNVRPNNGHLISVVGDNIIITDNEFENAERTSIELNFSKALITKNIFRNYVFQAGGPSMPGCNQTGGGPSQRGYGNYFLFSGSSGYIKDNTFIGYEPPTGYSQQAGAVIVGENVNSCYDNSGIKYMNNTLRGMVDGVFRSNNNKTISSTSYSIITDELIEVTGNLIETGGSFSGFYLGVPLATSYLVQSNNFNCIRTSTTSVNLFSGPPSPELNNSATTFPTFVFRGNNHNKTTTVNSTVGNSGFAWYDYQVDLALTATSVKTSSYTAKSGDLIPVDLTSASITITLPSAPVDGTRVAVKVIAVSGVNTCTINSSGSDVFNKAGGSTSLSLSLLNQGFNLQYTASTAIWYVVADNITLSSLDARYVTPSVLATKQDVLVSASNIKTVNGYSLLGTGDLSFGSGVANNDAAVLTVGTLADARLSTNVPLLNTAETFTGKCTFSPTVTASSGVASGTVMTPSVSAAANNDLMIGLDVSPTFTAGSFTGTQSIGIRSKGHIVPSAGSTYTVGTTSLPFSTIYSNQFQGTASTILASGTTGSSLRFLQGSTEVGRFFLTTGNFTLQNAGTFTDNGFRLEVVGSTKLNGAFCDKRTAVADAAYTALNTDYKIAYTSLTATRAVTLPASPLTNQKLLIKDEAGTAGTNNITIIGTVNGSSNPTAVNTAYGTYRLYYNGTAWFTE